MRLFAAEVLPRNIKRVIYLDCDIVVLDNIRGLWNADLDGKPLGAVPDYPRVPRLSAPERLASLGMPMGAIYVNSGVLVIDLERWRQGRLSERLLKFVTKKGAALYAHDQDAINVVLASEIRLLDCRWNLQARMYHTGRAFAPIEFEATREARRHPAVLHYTGSEKPWLFRSRIARKGDYIRYQRLTAWSSVEPTGLSALQRIEFRLDRVLSRLGVNYLQVLFKLGRVPTKVASLLSSLRQRSPRLFAFGAASIFRLGLLIVRSVQHDGAATSNQAAGRANGIHFCKDRARGSGEGGPALQHVVHGLGDLGMTRQPGALGAHPGHESVDQRSDMCLATGQPVGSGVAVDQALLGEDGIDLADSLQRQG